MAKKAARFHDFCQVKGQRGIPRHEFSGGLDQIEAATIPMQPNDLNIGEIQMIGANRKVLKASMKRSTKRIQVLTQASNKGLGWRKLEPRVICMCQLASVFAGQESWH